MARKRQITPPGWDNEVIEDICPLCNRPMPDGSWNEHHLIPATFKGKVKVAMHKVCHNTLHRTFTEREMSKYYHTIERLLEHEDIQKFVKWISNKPNDFYVKTKETKDRKQKRK